MADDQYMRGRELLISYIGNTTHKEIVQKIRTHCSKCKDDFATFNPSNISRYRNTSEARVDFLMAFADVMKLEEEEKNELLEAWHYSASLHRKGWHQADTSQNCDSPSLYVETEQTGGTVSDTSNASISNLNGWRWLFSDEPRQALPFGISLFILLNCALLDALVIEMDPMGFHRLFPQSAGTKFPIALNLLAFLVLAGGATALFYRQQNRQNTSRTVFPRAMWTVFPPVLLVYIPLFFTGSIGGVMFNLVVLSIFGGLFTAIVAFKDDELSLSQLRIHSLLTWAWTVCILLTVMGIGYMVVIHLKPDLALPYNLTLFFGSWEHDFGLLSYGEDEFLDKQRSGFLLLHISTIICLIGVASYMMRTIYGLKPQSQSETEII